MPDHEGSFNGSDGGNSSQRPTNDKKAAYIQDIQLACKTILQHIKESESKVLGGSDWSTPLATAPQAVMAMASLIKASAGKEVAGITIDQDVKELIGKELIGNKTVGRLPSPYFHSNLLHCGDLGKLAFLDAQKRMGKIHANAKRLIGDGGNISYIVELLEDPEEAKVNLKPEMEEVKEIAEGCCKECKEIENTFAYWHLVICNLCTTAGTSQENTLKEQRKVEEKQEVAEKSVKSYIKAEKTASENIERDNQALADAKENLDRSRKELDKLRDLPDIETPEYFVQLLQAQEAYPETPVPSAQEGALKKITAWIVGSSDKRKARKKASKDGHKKERDEAIRRAIAQAKQERDAAIAKAEAKLKNARDQEQACFNSLKQARAKLSESQQSLTKSQNGILEASLNLKKLGKEKVELATVFKILETSKAELSKLKKALTGLTTFFNAISNLITEEGMKDANGFLKHYDRNSESGNKPLTEKAKQKTLKFAMKIQGRFSTISDISLAYVQVSTKFIIPTLNQMEILATSPDSRWEQQREIFTRICTAASQGIFDLTIATSNEMDQNMSGRIGMIERLVIEASKV